jgi:hypothetical protein
MALWPALALLVAIGVDDLARRGIAPIAVLALWLIFGGIISRNTDFFNSLPNSLPALPREGFMQMVDILSESARAEDTIVLHMSPQGEEWNSQLLQIYYIYNNTPASYTHLEMITPYTVEVDEVLYMQAVQDYLSTVPVVWTGVVPQVPQTFRTDAFFRQLQRTHAHCRQILNRPDIQFNLYAQPTYPPVASFGDDAVQAELLWSLPEQATSPLDILLGWHRIPDLPPDTYSVGVHITNEAGELVKQVDYGLSNDAFSCHWSQIKLDDLPPGAYSVQTIVYDWRSGERMPADGGQSDARVTIGLFTIPALENGDNP